MDACISYNKLNVSNSYFNFFNQILFIVKLVKYFKNKYVKLSCIKNGINFYNIITYYKFL